MYCETCKLAFEGGGRCPACGGRKVREPLPEDLCYLTETDPMFGGMLKDVLRQNEIPVFTNSLMGAGMALRVGPMFDQIRFFVPFARLAAAREITEELFHAPTLSEREDETPPEED